ncbi:MAG TPA: hypothetical protein VND64_07660 [Pirellulales bacterium]|nr:hypothetical protein [Pirellulales bacterium]
MTPQTTENKIAFDCIAFKRAVQERMYEETRDLTTEQELAYYDNQARNGSLGAWWKAIVQRSLQVGDA